MDTRRRNDVPPYEAMLNIYTDTVFVAVVIDAVLLCPPSISILLLQPFWLFQPLFWDTPLFDGFVLRLGVPLLWNCNQSCINNLTSARFVALDA